MIPSFERQIEEALLRRVVDARRLPGGCVGDVFRVRLADDEQVVVKVDSSETPRLDREGYMLNYLAEHSSLPVPVVLACSPTMLVMSFVPGESRFDEAAQRHAARLLAALHGVTAPAFGLAEDTLIGGLHQPNSWTLGWIEFFRDQRLLHMGRAAMNRGRLPEALFSRLESFATRLDRWLAEPSAPSLLHGDVWTTNVLALGGRITGFLDPAIYYGHPEVELAFATLFGTFQAPFFHEYAGLRPIAPGFFEERRAIYNLYPLLVHVRLFGGGYVRAVAETLTRFGF